MSLPQNICTNPLQNLCANIRNETPDWMCRHSGAKIINFEKKYYKCAICCKKGRVIYKIDQSLMLATVRASLDK